MEAMVVADVVSRVRVQSQDRSLKEYFLFFFFFKIKNIYFLELAINM